MTLRSQAYQMEFEVSSLSGTTTLAMGCSRSRGVGSVMGLAWCLGEPKKRRFQLEVRYPTMEEFSYVSCPLTEEKPGSRGQMRESVSMATWKKAILQPSPSRGSLVQVVKGTCCGT